MKRERLISLVFSLLPVLAVQLLAARAELSVTHSTVANWSRLFDQDENTCIDPMNDLLRNVTHYVITVTTSAVNPMVNLTAKFQDEVKCHGKQIFTTWYEADCGNGGYFRPCTLLGDVTTGINHCQYACACADTGWEVALADRKDDNVHLCEVAVVGNWIF